MGLNQFRDSGSSHTVVQVVQAPFILSSALDIVIYWPIAINALKKGYLFINCTKMSIKTSRYIHVIKGQDGGILILSLFHSVTGLLL